jgi:lipooligosaccharide transport system ATP-binding protein
MKRRLQIARALIGEPELLILDEPTTGLDPQMRNELWNHLKKLKQKGVTIVLTTHYMQEAEQLCDELVIMNMGKIVAQGQPRQLVEKYVSPFVIEVIFENGLNPQSLDELGFESLTTGHLDLADRRLYYTQNGEALIRDIMAKNSQAMIYQRHATLDDVFLKITGKSLDT